MVLARSPVLSAHDLGLSRDLAPPEAADGVALPHDLTLDDAARRYALAAVERADGNQSAAARTLGISRNKLARLLTASRQASERK